MRAWDLEPGGTLTVNLGGLAAAERQLAEWALGAWTAASGIRFVQKAGGAQITFTDAEEGAVTRTWYYQDGTLDEAQVNIPRSWTDGAPALGGHAYETYLHEIGHALGLAHSGPYDGAFDPDSRLWDNDTTLMTVMSYFGPDYDPLSPVGRDTT